MSPVTKVLDPVFRNSFSRKVFREKYNRDNRFTSWDHLARTIADEVCGGWVGQGTVNEVAECISSMKFLPGGRYLYYAGRPLRYWNNCFLLRAEHDTREEWADLAQRVTSCLMTGGGIGVDYSALRGSGAPLSRTGGQASGPIPLMHIVNEIGRNVMQGGSRRSAIYASHAREHPDVEAFLVAKDWDRMVVAGTELTRGDLKKSDFNFPCPLDYTNISVNYGDSWLNEGADPLDPVFLKNCEHALRTGEPGFSFNFGNQKDETLRNACCEVTSADDSDVCNLGSVNLSRTTDINDFRRTVELGTLFLLCGTLRADLPYPKVADVREKNRRLGLGLMGVHEWLLTRGYRYEVVSEFHQWLETYRSASRATADVWADHLSVSRPVACRAIAPTGTIGILAGTTTGIEPLIAKAYKRRWLKGNTHHYNYVVDSTARILVEQHGIDPDAIETALSLASDPERRIAFQADVQDYVDMAISSTINLPQWGSCHNNEDRVESFAGILAKHAHRLRGFTCYPDGARGGQPITEVPYEEAARSQGKTYREKASDICDFTGKGGTCGE